MNSTSFSRIPSAERASLRTLLGTSRTSRVRLASGLELSHIDRGPPNDTALLLVHGLSDSCRAYEPLLAELPDSLRVVAVTLRGHGQSDHPPAGYALTDFAEDLVQFLDASGIQHVVIAGHSLGASVALRFAIDHRERTRGLALLGAFSGYRHNPAVVELAAVVGQLEDPVDRGFIRDFQLATLNHPIPEEQLERAISESQALPARVWKAIVDELLSPNGELPLREVRVPALLLWGARDAFVTRADQERLLRDIAGARLVEYPDGGHAFHWEDPRPTAIQLGAFAETCFGRI
jgi:pimeloyl-ACP methyl ester carboxylesterase